MPYLELTPAPATGRLGVGVPGYAHPMVAPTEWAELARPGAPLHWAVLRIAGGSTGPSGLPDPACSPGPTGWSASGGPGSRPDPYCLAAAARLREAGVRVLGHLDLRGGTRPFGELVSDAHRFLDWYAVEGFYVDRAPTDRASLPEARRALTTLRALGESAHPATHLVLGHGTHPDPGYAEAADQLVTFSGAWPDYRWSQVAQWTADHPAERFCHLVYGVPRPHLEEALRIARWQGAGTVYFTDRTKRDGVDPWEGLPGFWDEIVSRIGPGISE